MNSQQYVDKFIELQKGSAEPTPSILARIIKMIILETEEIRIARKTRTDSGLIAIFQEQNRKWIAVKKKLDPILEKEGMALDPEGFRNIVKRHFDFDLETIR